MDSNGSDRTLPLGDAELVDSLRGEFEREAGAGGAARIEDYLGRVSERLRAAAFAEFLEAELKRRVRRQEAVTPEDYLGRFPAFEAAIRKACADAHDAERTLAHGAEKPQSGLHVRCPHCHNPIELVPDAELESIRCDSCGSQFSLTGGDEATRDARSIAQVGHFKLVERLGLGAFGAVWKALDTELDRTVAIKIPRAGQLDKHQQDFFFREARSAAQLRHPNIVPVYEVGREGDTLYIVSEFVRGVTLSDRLSAGALGAREAAELCATIAEALEHAHQQGVIHRDLKPANVMIDGRGAPHLMDFGLARREAGEITMTLDGQVLGTPAYMSPEQAQGEAHLADRRSDVYSLGVMLFELLTGELPFRGNARMLIHQVIHDEAPTPRKLNAAVPKDLETITLKCMEKDPKRRFDTAAELADELRRYVGGQPIRSRPISKLEQGWRWCRRKPLVAGLTAAVAGLVTVLAIAAPIVAIRQAALRRVAEQNEQDARELQITAMRNERIARASEQRQKELAVAEAKARESAELSEKNLAAAQEASERTIYAQAISRAQQEWDSGNMSQCEDLLDGTRSDLRGWEWEYLKNLCHAEQATLHGLRSMPNRFAFHKDGKHFAGFGIEEGRVVVWDLQTGLIVTQHPYAGWAISRDGSTAAGQPTGRLQQGLRELDLLFSGKSPLRQDHLGRITVFDVLTGKTISQIIGHEGGLAFAHFSTDGSRLATRGNDATVRVWDVKSGSEIVKIDEPERGYGPALALSPDGNRVGWKAAAGTILVYDVNSGQQIFKTLEPLRSFDSQYVAFNGDGTLLASGTQDQTAVWDVDRGTRKSVMHGHRGPVLKFEFSPTENVLASWGQDCTARLWDVESGRELLCLRSPKDYLVWSFPEIAYSADGRQVATVGTDASIKIWDSHAGDAPPTGQPETNANGPDASQLETVADYRQDLDWLFGHRQAVMDFDFTPDGKSVVSASEDGAVKIWDLATKRVIRNFTGHGKNVSAVRVSPDGELIASGSGGWADKDRGTVLIWSRETGEILHRLEGHRSAITQLRFTRDGKRLISASGHQGDEPGDVFIWDVASGKLVQQTGYTSFAVKGLAVSPDGRIIACCGWSGMVHLWDVDSALEIKVLGHEDERFAAVDFSPDGTMLAAAGMNHSVVVFDFASGGVLWKEFNHSGPVQYVAFAGDKRLFSAALDGTARLWDVRSGECLLTLPDYPRETYHARLSPDGRTLVCCAGSDPRLSVRRLPQHAPDNLNQWETILADDFERSELGDHWTSLNGMWTVDHGVARGVLKVMPSEGPCEAILAAATPMPESVEVSYDAWSPSSLVCETKFINSATAKSLIALHISVDNWGSFNGGQRGFAVVAQLGANNYQELASRRREFGFESGRRYHIRTLRNQGRLRMFVDEQLVLETDVPESLVVPQLTFQGTSGAEGDVIYIDNVVVQTPKAAEEPPDAQGGDGNSGPALPAADGSATGENG